MRYLLLVLLVLGTRAAVFSQAVCDTLPIPFNTKVQQHMYRQAFRVPIDADSLFTLTKRFLQYRFGDLTSDKKENKWLFYYEGDTAKNTLVYRYNQVLNDTLLVRCQWSFLLFDSLALSVIHQFEPLYNSPEGVYTQYFTTHQPETFSRQVFLESSTFCADRKRFDRNIRSFMASYAAYLQKQTPVIVDKKIEVMD